MTHNHNYLHSTPSDQSVVSATHLSGTYDTQAGRAIEIYKYFYYSIDFIQRHSVSMGGNKQHNNIFNFDSVRETIIRDTTVKSLLGKFQFKVLNTYQYYSHMQHTCMSEHGATQWGA